MKHYRHGIHRFVPFVVVPMILVFLAVSIAWLDSLRAAVTDAGSLPPGVRNTQDPADAPPTPEESLAQFDVSEGFQVSLFAAEPDVQQPVAMALDDRGRLWVAESYQYGIPWTDRRKGHDRIVILEDANEDGRFDRRTVFAEGLYNLTGLEFGFGGVWALCAPHLLFIPDADGDDVPDGEPIVKLDGWSIQSKHNIVNGLAWAPDGWLWGRHGIIDDSHVGPPGTPAENRVRVDCGIWRYHPQRQVVEVVVQGTTNPWGLDFDDYGEAFFTNCVIGHLWHVVPGAYYRRMYGQHDRSHLFELIDATSDHLHWAGGAWTASRSGQEHLDAGGGHAHCGAMIYLGDNWPEKFRGDLFTCNIHGRRVNRDRLVRRGAGYIGRHAEDLLSSRDQWFRGIELIYGPDGGVFISDWCEFGECHDNDGVHRSSGRIYKVTYGKPKRSGPSNLALLADEALVELQLHANDWYVRHARRLLQERAAAGENLTAAHRLLRDMLHKNEDVTRRLRALWALRVSGGLSDSDLVELLEDGSEHVRAWAVRLLVDDSSIAARAIDRFAAMAERDDSPKVRLALASALRRIDVNRRWAIATALAHHAEDAADPQLPLMIWYGIEPAVPLDPKRAVQLAETTRIGKLRRFIARRLAAEREPRLEGIVELLGTLEQSADQLALIDGMLDGLEGRRAIGTPAGWSAVYRSLSRSGRPGIREKARLLAVHLGDVNAIAELASLVLNANTETGQRTRAFEVLAAQRHAELPDLSFRLLGDPVMRSTALRGLAAFDRDETPERVLKAYPRFSIADRQAAIATLASRGPYAAALLQAVESGTVKPDDISVTVARQIHALGDSELNDLLNRVWGSVRATPGDKKELIAKYKKQLSDEYLGGADVRNGRLLYDRTCRKCHKLHGEGDEIGPDLTGSNRDDLHYLLENLLDPSAVIGKDYQLHTILLTDGRLLQGIVVGSDANAITLQTAEQRVIVVREDIELSKRSSTSMMPEGQVEKMPLDDVRDLIAYLQSKRQVPLPDGTTIDDGELREREEE
ncbi:MAG: PVC-type heme-binding CxxCH protein [Planctomycetales bacterium]